MKLFERSFFAYVVMAGVTAAVLWPLVTKKDSFPLSNYPMFAEHREPRTTLEQAIAVLEDGSDRTLGPRYLGTDEVLQAKAHLERAVRYGGANAENLCAEIAKRVAADRSLRASKVEVRTVTYDAIAYFAEPGAKPLLSKLHVSCPVLRGDG